jgi:enoyl reductase-like protein
MGLTQEQKDQFNNLIDYRDQIIDSLFHIERILKVYFPEEFEVAYQHWIPQIVTALYSDERWLSRSDRNMQQTINRIMDKIKSVDSFSGVQKYI